MIDVHLTHLSVRCPHCQGSNGSACSLCSGTRTVLEMLDPSGAAFLSGADDLRQFLVRATEVAEDWRREEIAHRRLGDRVVADLLERQRVAFLMAVVAVECILERGWLPAAGEQPRRRVARRN